MAMHSTAAFRSRSWWIAIAVFAGAAAAIVPHLMSRAGRSAEALRIGPHAPTIVAAPTDADGLRRRISELEERLREHAGDANAAVPLADALLRLARATTDSRPAGRAEAVLKGVLKEMPAEYNALRILGAIYLSEHRFREALTAARRARDLRPTMRGTTA